MTAVVEVAVTGIAAGGDGVGHLPDGRAVFVHGGIPGDRLEVRLDEEKPRFARATAVDVLDPGPGRVEPAPDHARCGACTWQHVDVPTQRALKTRIVTDALTRIGKLQSVPDIDPGPDLPTAGFRTTVRAAVDDEGRLGMRSYHGHEVVPFAELACPVPHPLLADLLSNERYAGAREVTVRASVATGALLAVTDAELRAGRRAWLHEDVAGRRFRVSAGSFFQSRPDGAAALVDAVRAEPPHRLVDLYGGVGLFAATLDADSTMLVEANRSAVADARINVPDARIIRADVRRWRPSTADAVVADPSRHGLGAAVVDRIAATRTNHVALVSCDPGALGRDAGLLVGAGYALDTVTLVDLFPHTPHVEVVTRWVRDPPRGAAP